MRWNCPHCEELVTAGIDFESTKQAYVRCGKCGGTALIHRSAALAGFVKARRLEEEAQLNAELKMCEAKRIIAEAEVRRPIEMGMETISSQPPMPIMEPEMIEVTEEIGAAPVVPPPFNGPRTDVSAAPPIFSYPKPPAFLVKGVSPQGADTVTKSKVVLAGIAVWVAAILAIASGIYLYIQGKQALAISRATMATEADRIVSKASSGIRTGEASIAKSIGVVRVPRAIVRGAPSIEAASLGTLDQATVITVFEEKEGWIRIESPKLTVGTASAWVRADLVARIPN